MRLQVRGGRRGRGALWKPLLAVLAASLSAGGLLGGPESSALEEARKHLQERRFAEAQRAAQAALSEAESSSGPASAEVERPLDLLLQALRRGGRGGEAETRALAQRAVALKEKLHGPDHLETAGALNLLGSLLYESGRPLEARSTFERARAILEKSLGPDDPRVLIALNNIASSWLLAGDYPAARPLYERVLKVREKRLGPDHPEVALSLRNLASLLEAEGDYPGALSRYERALALEEKVPGPDRLELAATLNNLALLHQEDLGDFAAARPLFERALSIRERALGPDHPLVAQSRHNLAFLLFDLGEPARARTLLEEALQLWEKRYGPDHPDVGSALNNLGWILHSTGELEAARPLYRRALAVREKILGPDHPDLAWTLANLGLLEEARGDYAEARALLERALRIREKCFVSEHRLVARSRRELAELLLRSGEAALALETALRAEESGREFQRLAVRSLAERQALSCAAERAGGLDLALSLAVRLEEPASTRRAWDCLVRSRALVLDGLAARLRAPPGGDPETARLSGELASASRELANLLVRGGAGDGSGGYRALLDGARARREAAERALAGRSAAFRVEEARSRAGLREVAAALPPKTALVAFARHELLGGFPGVKGAGRPAKEPGAPDPAAAPALAYLAFVLASKDSEPAVVELGSAAEVEGLVAGWGREAARADGAAGPGARERESSFLRAGEALRRAVWDPVAARFDGAERVILVPDGELQVVNLATLPGGGSYLIETGPLIHLLSAERDLLGPEPGGTEGRGGLLALGGPDFDDRSLFAAASAPAERAAASAGGLLADGGPYRGRRSDCPEFQALRFEPLPGSGKEAEEVAALWRARSGSTALLLSGSGAGEAAFKSRAPGCRVLHLATHGFFLAGGCPSALPGSRGIGGLAPARALERPAARGEPPLLLSGLVLAGANHRSAAGEGEEDGILTAEEIAALDLSSVEWAVLSSCQSGLGRVVKGEPLFGLRRAFQAAGARTVISSLWAVDDEAARLWMTALYRARLERGLGTAEAVRQAGLSILRARRAAGQSTHPFTWGGFIGCGGSS